MEAKELQNLSREDLLQLVGNLQLKYEISTGDLLPLQLDFEALLESTSDIIFVLNKDENLIYRNSAWKTYFPSLVKKPVGGHYADYIPVNEKERADYVFSSVINEGKVFENELIKTHDEKGEEIYFSTSWSPIRSPNGDIRGLVATMKNVTDRVLARKELKESSKILVDLVKEQVGQAGELQELSDVNREIIQNAPIGIIMMDPSGVILGENPTMMDIMGRGPEESVVGVNLLKHPGFIKSGFVEMFNEGVSGKKTIRANNRPYIPIAGKGEIIINVTMTPILKDDKVARVILMVEDYTEQSMIAKKANWVEKTASMGMIASGVAMELGNPINKMYMDLNFVDSNVEKESRAAEYVESLKNQLHRIKNISEQLQALADTQSVEKEVCEINKVLLNHPLDVLIGRLRSDGVEVDINIPEEGGKVKATRKQLKQILFDIIENAAEAMPDQGKLTIDATPVETVEGAFVLITITDTGIGMPKESLKRVFEPFYTTKGDESTGLGLMIAATVIENVGGTIGIRSEPGKGTSIKLAIPRAAYKENTDAE
ncbi:MAG: PAS domain S-box protein [bacterium]|nr:PAS domain S-box protein [bacterium]